MVLCLSILVIVAHFKFTMVHFWSPTFSASLFSQLSENQPGRKVFRFPYLKVRYFWFPFLYDHQELLNSLFQIFLLVFLNLLNTTHLKPSVIFSHINFAGLQDYLELAVEIIDIHIHI